MHKYTGRRQLNIYVKRITLRGPEGFERNGGSSFTKSDGFYCNIHGHVYMGTRTRVRTHTYVKFATVRPSSPPVGVKTRAPGQRGRFICTLTGRLRLVFIAGRYPNGLANFTVHATRLRCVYDPCTGIFYNENGRPRNPEKRFCPSFEFLVISIFYRFFHNFIISFFFPHEYQDHE
jgi:hypothetical protein